MQTFLPYYNFASSAQSLDRQRLGKQRVETLQIAKVVVARHAGVTAGWANHPAVKMWLDSPQALLAYQFAVCSEWTGRGYKDTCLDKTLDLLRPFVWFDAPEVFRTERPLGLQMELARVGDLPSWLGDEDFHLSHRSNLLRKDPEWYGHFWEGDPDDLPYVWPVT